MLDIQDILTLEEVSKRFGLTKRALRFYDATGLVVPQRNGNMRVYSRRDCERMELVQDAKELFFTLREIRSMLAEDPTGKPSLVISPELCEKQIRFLEQKRSKTDVAIEKLRERLAQKTP